MCRDEGMCGEMGGCKGLGMLLLFSLSYDRSRSTERAVI